jgi:hypothetical protein
MKEEEKLRILELLAKSGMKANQLIIENSGNITYNDCGEQHQEPEQEQVPADIVCKALNKCKSYIWGHSAYAVAFCVCRDLCGWQDNASYFERQMQQQGIVFPPGTINTTISRNPFMKLNVDKWDGNGVMERVIKLRDEFQQQVGFAEQCKQKA